MSKLTLWKGIRIRGFKIFRYQLRVGDTKEPLSKNLIFTVRVDAVLEESCTPGKRHKLVGGHMCSCSCVEDRKCVLRCEDHLTAMASVGRRSQPADILTLLQRPHRTA